MFMPEAKYKFDKYLKLYSMGRMGDCHLDRHNELVVNTPGHG